MKNAELIDKSAVDRSIADVRTLVSKSKSFSADAPKYFIRTYGCQMNEHDSEIMAFLLNEMGYEKTEELEDANLILMNTCMIRENAENRFFGNLGAFKKLKKEKKDLKIAVCGCMTQRPHIIESIKQSYPYVDIVFGTQNIYALPKLLLERLQLKKGQVIEIVDDNDDIIEGIGASRNVKHKAFVNITFGCNNFCTFCVVPYTRGREKSRLPKDIISEIKRLVDDGVKEVWLLGQNVNSYGKRFIFKTETSDNGLRLKTKQELAEDEGLKGYTFARLLRDIAEIPGDFRLRFMTSHPKDLSDELIETIKSVDKIPNSIHLPLQAASNALLKRMNRRYTKESYLDLIAKLRENIPDIAISTDLIIGFPGETEDDVDELIDLIKKVEYDSAYTFIYSPREGTPAAKYVDQIPEKTKHERFDRMLEQMNEIIIKKNEMLVGREYRVLADEFSDGFLSGRTYCLRTVTFEGKEDLLGKFVKVRITGVKRFSLEGELID